MRKQIYLAGPDVFYPDALDRLQRKKDICAQYGYVGLSPFDNEVDFSKFSSLEDAAFRIAFLNEQMIRDADAICANLEPFRGPGADQGTVYEVGYGAALKKKCFGYGVSNSLYSRVCSHFGILSSLTTDRDPDGLTIENFGLQENLMIQNALLDRKIHANFIDLIREISERGLL